MTENFHCLVWDRTRDLVKDRGFDMSQKCPMNEVCHGEKCIFSDAIKNFANNLDSQKTKEKLAALREELKKF